MKLRGVPHWLIMSVERYLAAQERQAAAFERLAESLEQAEEPEDEQSALEDGSDAEDVDTWYDRQGNPLMGPKEKFGVSDDLDESELVFIQRIPHSKKPS